MPRRGVAPFGVSARLRRSRRQIGTGLLCALYLCGCPGESSRPQPEAQPLPESVDVRVAVPAGLGLAEAWQVPISEWEATAGSQCVIDEIALGSSVDAIPPKEASLAVVPLPSVASLIDHAWPAPIDDESAARPMAHEVFDKLRECLSQHNGGLIGIPIDCPVLACYYRADLLETAGLSPPATWEEYASLVDSLNEWAPGLTAVEPWGDEFRASMFLARAVPAALHPDNYSLFLDVETGEPLISDPPFEAALDESVRVLALLDPRSQDLSPGGCLREILSGRCAMAIGALDSRSVTGKGEADESRPARDENARIGIALLPGTARVYQRQTGEWQPVPDGADVQHVSLVGFEGWFICAAADADPEVRAAAWRLWTTLDSPEFRGPSRPWADALVRISQLSEVLQNTRPGFRTDEWRAQVQTAADTLNSTRLALDLPLPERDRFRDLLTQHVSAALAGEQSPHDALQDVRNGWSSLIEELGRARIVNVYRTCSGLAPLPSP